MGSKFIYSFLLNAKGPIIIVFSSSVMRFCFFGISLRPTIEDDLLIFNRSSVGFGFPKEIYGAATLDRNVYLFVILKLQSLQDFQRTMSVYPFDHIVEKLFFLP